MKASDTEGIYRSTATSIGHRTLVQLQCHNRRPNTVAEMVSTRGTQAVGRFADPLWLAKLHNKDHQRHQTITSSMPPVGGNTSLTSVL